MIQGKDLPGRFRYCVLLIFYCPLLCAALPAFLDAGAVMDNDRGDWVYLNKNMAKNVLILSQPFLNS